VKPLPVLTPSARQIVPDTTKAMAFWVSFDPQRPEAEPFTDKVPIIAWAVTVYEQIDRWRPLTHVEPIPPRG
jgi:hypothetical protein